MCDKQRCGWAGNDPLYIQYHDKEWGCPVYDDRLLFEMLILEGAQAGLSWITILKKRESYRQAFDNFDPKKIIKYDEFKVQALMNNSGIVRNRLKINATITNAKAFLDVVKEYGSFSNYLWAYVNHKPIIEHRNSLKDIPARTLLSDQISKDLKKRGFKFVGSTIIYAYLQAVGIVNDHISTCFLYGHLTENAVQ